MTHPKVCPNCGFKSKWLDVCPNCHYDYKKAQNTYVGAIKLYFCAHKDCGCTYGNVEGNCPTHGPFEEDVKTPTDWPPRSEK